MIAPVTPAARPARAPQAKAADAAATPGDEEQHALDADRAAFNLQVEYRAEFEREREALEALVLAQLKDEDEVMKKWIAMI